MRIIRTASGHEYMVDDHVFDRLNEYSYFVIKKTGRAQRVVWSTRLKKVTKRIGLAQDVLQLPSSKIVLFKNGKPTDCRMKNLMVVSKKKRNCLSKLPKSNTSGYRGVSYKMKTKKYEAYIRKNYKKIALGSFNDVEKAAAAYNKAAIKYFGKDYSRLNIVPEGM